MSYDNQDAKIKSGQAWNIAAQIAIQEGRPHDLKYRFSLWYKELQLLYIKDNKDPKVIVAAVGNPDLIESMASVERLIKGE